jgi:RNA polymerase sigma factor (sigma-70 family)
MNRGEPPTEEEFKRLLAWLDPSDEEAAGRRYLHIRSTLTKVLARRGCPLIDAEELVDITFNRVSKKVKDVAPTYVGDPAAYFHAVALRVYKEYLREMIRIATNVDSLPRPDGGDDAKHRLWDCLDECLEKLSPDDRDLIVKYYRDEGRAKIEQRRKLAENHGITVHALRMRASRIRKQLETCGFECLKRKEGE